MSKDKENKKVPFKVFSKKGFAAFVLAGVMLSTPFALIGCGDKGDKGDTGAAGANGKSAYELAVEAGFEGTLQDWLNSINGTTWLSGVGVPQQNVGKIGDFYMDEFSHTVYEKKSNGWVLITQIAESEKAYAYYDDLESAIEVVNNKSYTDETLMVDKAIAKVGIYVENDIPHVKLFDDVAVSEKLVLNNDLVLYLNAKTISFTSSVGFEVDTRNFVIDAEKAGSKIVLNSNEESSTILKIESGKVSILGGEIISTSNGVGTSDVPNPCIHVNNSADLYLKNTKVVASDETNGTISSIIVERGGEAYLSNVNVDAVAPYGLNVSALLNKGETTVVGGTFVAKANYTANSQGNDYATNSRGIHNFGVIKLKDATVLGTHSGMTSLGVAYVDGGVFGGYSHGGIYFSGGQTTSYVKNATIEQIDMFEGYIDDGVAGTNMAGMYVGGANNIIIYMDNCVFTAVYYPIVMKSGCSDNKLYVSNSTVTEGFERYIRLDTTNNTLYIGKGNNFDIITCYREGAAVETNEDYLINIPIEEEPVVSE